MAVLVIAEHNHAALNPAVYSLAVSYTHLTLPTN